MLGASTPVGYDLHITRRQPWQDDEQPGIPEDEWLAYVASNPRIRMAQDEYNPLMAICECGSRYESPWLDWFEGDVFSKFPDEPLIRFMIEVARDLGASVQGDEGGQYRLNAKGQLVVVSDGREYRLADPPEGGFPVPQQPRSLVEYALGITRARSWLVCIGVLTVAAVLTLIYACAG